MEPRVCLITLGVNDLDRATAFYEGLGWPRRVRSAHGVSLFKIGGLGLSLYPRAELAKDAGVPLVSGPSQGFTLAYNTRSRDEMAKVLAQAEALGGQITQQARDAVWAGRHGHFCDLDGFLWEAAYNPGFLPEDNGSIILPP